MKEKKDYFKQSHELLARFLNGDKEVTLKEIEFQELKDRFNYLWDCWSFQQKFLKPVVLLPLMVYFFFLD